ncbi:MAG: TlpA disulfide reductase family protein [Planctomycetota bacterium]
MRLRIAPAALLGLVLAPAALAELKVGDPAPPIGKKIEWVKGGPIDPAKGVGKEIYVLEFWATWCAPCVVQIPHTTELQRKYEKAGVRFIGLTSPGWQRQRLEDVKRFVEGQGDKMAYTVGFDSTEEAHNNYMLAAGAMGIPYACIIAKDGRIAWHGYPDGQLEQVLEQVVAGKYDVQAAAAAAANKQKIDGLATQFSRAVTFGQWEKALEHLDQMLRVDESNEMAIRFSLQIISKELKDRAHVRSWVETYLREHGKTAAGLTLVVNTLMAFPDLGDRHPDLALAAAAAACAADPRSVEALQAHARALHDVGKIDQAIEWQEKAVAVADKTDEAQVRAALKFYRTCKELAER